MPPTESGYSLMTRDESEGCIPVLKNLSCPLPRFWVSTEVLSRVKRGQLRVCWSTFVLPTKEMVISRNPSVTASLAGLLKMTSFGVGRDVGERINENIWRYFDEGPQVRYSNRFKAQIMTYGEDLFSRHSSGSMKQRCKQARRSMAQENPQHGHGMV